MTGERRIVISLGLAQALFQTCMVLMVTVGGLAGASLAPSPALATLPIAFTSLGTAIATFPASMLMGRVGRRPGFILGAVFGVAGGGMATLAILGGSFWLLCFATAVVGAYSGFAQFYRFAAAEAASEAFKSRALSLVLAGGVIAALAGPNLGAATKDLLGPATYAGSFLSVMALSAVAAVLLAFTRIETHASSASSTEPARPLGVIVRQPRFIAAVVGAAVGFAVMVMVMTATPISMVAHDHTVTDAAFVIQWHVLGMYVPSFFTGWLVKRFGLTPMMLTGLAAFCVHITIALSGFEVAHYLSALVLLGLGWNLLYVGGSTLLTETYRPSERAKVQGLNDFLIVGVGAISSFSAGALVETFGWRGLNLAVVPLLALAAAVILGASAFRKRAIAAP